MIFDASECENRIGYVFKDKMLLRQCFTHSSYAHEHKTSDNELLEFFGDAIIEFVITEHLFFTTFGNEGDLTVLRAETVSKEPLLRAVKKLGIGELMLLGNGQNKTARESDKLFSSLFEAITAGIYIDGGMGEVKKFLSRTLIKEYEKRRKDTEKSKSSVGNKNALQEYVQKRKMGSVSYETLYKKGPDHMPEFRVAALLNGERLSEADGKSIKAAGECAAKKALDKLKKEQPDGKKQ